MLHRISLLILARSTGSGVLSFSMTPPTAGGSALKAVSGDRRSFLATSSASAAAALVGPALSLGGAPGVANAAGAKDALVSDLKDSLDKIQAVPDLVKVNRG